MRRKTIDTLKLAPAEQRAQFNKMNNKQRKKFVRLALNAAQLGDIEKTGAALAQAIPEAQAIVAAEINKRIQDEIDKIHDLHRQL